MDGAQAFGLRRWRHGEAHQPTSPLRRRTSASSPIRRRSARTTVAAVKETILAKLTLDSGKSPTEASDRDWFVAAALTARDRIVHHWAESKRRMRVENRKRVYYLSLEFLIGRLLGEVLNNLELTEPFDAALGDLGVDLEHMFSAEPDAALGNGGLGRLAACFMESMATLGIPAFGYGIRYDHGLFRQVIKDGAQQEYPENWLSFGNPWEFERPGGHLRRRLRRLRRDDDAVAAAASRAVWHPGETVQAVAYDTPVVGWKGRHVNPLRLWSARAVDPLRLDVFNAGDHVAALTEQARAETISKILYPSDETPAGQELRLRQEYFFVSASLQDLVRPPPAHLRRHPLAARQGGDPAQRHASGDRRRRADAHPGRRARPRLGRGVGHHRPHALLHQPHAAARGAGDLAGAALRARCCRATCRSST